MVGTEKGGLGGKPRRTLDDALAPHLGPAGDGLMQLFAAQESYDGDVPDDVMAGRAEALDSVTDTSEEDAAQQRLQIALGAVEAPTEPPRMRMIRRRNCWVPGPKGGFVIGFQGGNTPSPIG